MRNKAVIALTLALTLITVYQQGQLKQLRNEYKALNTQNLDLLNRLRDLEAQNEQSQALLEQINARVGYMDSKVAKVIDRRTTHERLDSDDAAEARQTEEGIEESPPERSERGLLDSLQELFH